MLPRLCIEKSQNPPYSLGAVVTNYWCMTFRSDISHQYNPDFCVMRTKMKVRVTYISWLSDIASYFEDFLMDECHTQIMGQW